MMPIITIITIMLLLCNCQVSHDVDAFVAGGSPPKRFYCSSCDGSFSSSASGFIGRVGVDSDGFNGPRPDRRKRLRPLESQISTRPPEEEIDLALSEEEIRQSSDYLASLIRTHLSLRRASGDNDVDATTAESQSDSSAAPDIDNSASASDRAVLLAKHRFVDLTGARSSELLLEGLFSLRPPPPAPLIRRAVLSLQSLLVYGMQMGVKGGEEAQSKMVRHLFRRTDPPLPPAPRWKHVWTSEDVRRLKFYRQVELGKAVLASMKRRRTAVGAYDLLVEMGVWKKDEELGLLRSGFPVRFLEGELACSFEVRRDYKYCFICFLVAAFRFNPVSRRQAESKTHDPDALLSIRQDLRHHKVYTIDSYSTRDIDDGISVEVLPKSNDDNGEEERYRYWIHIADVDRWAERGSELLRVAERRGTSLYLPLVTLDMFPLNMVNLMSLTSNTDKYALSLGVELNPDGSIDASSIIVTPSLIHVNYRLTYDQVDEMLDEGLAFFEEWQVGALLDAATKRRRHRVERGSTEGFVPCPIPKSVLTVAKAEKSEGGEDEDEYDIEVEIETTHNSGGNVTALEAEGGREHYDPHASPVSSSQLIVTEMMILAGEAIGKWHGLQTMRVGEEVEVDGCAQVPNVLKLPYRRQPAPDYKTRVEEARQADFLFGMNKLYPHAWYCRRFFKPVQVSEEPGPHFGMGLDCYVQWTSPIRRLTDLQVHAAIKRYLRRRKVNELLSGGIPIPPEITNFDLGYDISQLRQNSTKSVSHGKPIDAIDYTSGLGMIFAARPIQTSSSNYWLFEYIRRKVEGSEHEVMFECVVLGCVNKDRYQYAIYVYELGLEHRYLSESGKLDDGERLWLKVTSVNPRLELLTFSLASKSGGIAA